MRPNHLLVPLLGFVLLLLVSEPVWAQFPASPNLLDENGKRTGHWTILYDSNFFLVNDPDSVGYYRLIRFEAGVPVGKIRDFTKAGLKYWDGYALSIDPYVFDGESNHYHENGQLSYRQVYVKGKRDGPCWEYYPNGTLKSEGQHKDDEQDGVWKYYHENGTLQLQLTFIKGRKSGPAKFYHPNGRVSSEGSYRLDYFDGVWTNYSETGVKSFFNTYHLDTLQGPHEEYFPDGTIKEKNSYRKGKLHGAAVVYHENGKLKSKGQYLNDERDGAWAFYHPNGQVKSRGKVKNGLFEGTWEYFYENGQLSERGLLVNNLYEGPWDVWYDNGKPKARIEYARDSSNGKYVSWYQNGQVEEEGQNLRGQRTGPWKKYTEQGTLLQEGSYLNGETEGLWKYYDEAGWIKTVGYYHQGQRHGETKRFFENGQLSEWLFYKDGLMDSTYVGYYESGQVNAEGSYRNDLRHGNWKWYHENGTLSGESTYIDGKENGRTVSYFPNGKKKIEGVRRDDQMVGHTKFFFQDGNVEQEGNFIDGLFDGRWVVYDSATRAVVEELWLVKGKRHGVLTYFDTKGKPTSKEYYINGFQETAGNIRDSIDHLINIKDFSGALAATDWMERVAKRDTKKAADRTLPIHIRSRVYAAMADYKNALIWDKKYMKAVERYEGKSSTNYRVAVHNVATALHGLGKMDEALKYYDVAIELSKVSGLGESYWSSVNNKVYCLNDADRQPEAIAIFEEELRKAEAQFGADSSAGWYLRHEVAEFYYDRVSDYEKSYKMFDELLDDILVSGQENHLFEYDCNSRIATMFYNNLNRPQDAIPYYRDAIWFAERNKLADRPLYAQQLVDLFYITQPGQMADSTTRAINAETTERMERAVNVVVASAAHAELLLALGNDRYDHDRYGEAFEWFKKSEIAFINGGKANTLRQAASLQSMAFALITFDRRRGNEAEGYFLKSMDIRSKLVKETDYDYLTSLRSLASFYSTLERYDKAIPLLKRVIELAGENGDQALVAKAYQNLGEAHYYMWRYQEAIPAFEKALAFHEGHRQQLPLNHINCVGFLARSYSYLDQHDKAVALSTQAVSLAEEMYGKKSDTYYYRLSSLGTVLERANRYTEALKSFTEAAQGLKENYGDKSSEYFGAQRNVIKVWSSLSEYKRVIELGDAQLATVAQTIGIETDGYLDLVYLVADAYANLHNYEKAEQYYVSAVEVSRKVNGPESPTTATHLSRLGNFYDRRNRIEEAEANLREALANMRTSGYAQSSVLSAYLVDVADVLASQEKNKEAEALFLEAYRLAQVDTVDNITTYVTAGQDLARFYNKVGRYRDSEKLVKTMSTIIERRYGKKYYYASVREGLVFIYTRQGRYVEALAEGLSLLEILEGETGQDHWLVLSLHNTIGIIYDDEENFDKAAKEFKFCVDALNRKKKLTEVDQASLATYHANLGRIELVLGRYEEAGQHLEECAKIRKAAKIVPSQSISAAYQSTLAAYYRAIGRMDKAEATWLELTKTLLDFSRDNFYFMSDEEKAQFWKSISGYFRVFQSFGVERAIKNPAITADMYNVQLATKAALLSASNKIRKRILSSRDTSMVNMYYHWTHKKEQLAQLYSAGVQDAAQRKEIEALEESARTLEKEMNITAEDLSADKGGETVTWKNVQATLGPDEAAVEIIRFRHYNLYARDSVLYAALVLTAETKQYPKLVVLRNGSLLEGRYLKYYRNCITTKTTDTISYHQFWEPLAGAVGKKSRVYLSLDGAYNQINLNTLLSRDGNYLVDEKNLTILSNTKDLLSIKSRKLKRISLSSAALFGFPTYFLGKGKMNAAAGSTRDFDATAVEVDRTGISPLLGTRQEIEAVGNILEGHKMKTTVYSSEMASEKQIKQVQHPRVLHIATHGYFMDEQGSVLGEGENPMLRAGLLLAGAANFIQDRSRIEEENGILTAYEASNLDLDNTDLVVLSACETAKGEVENGEGVYGLQRAFQTAGAQTIVMSLWKVDDAATKLLMSTFYSKWMSGMTKAQALKAAQVELKRQYPQPYYWGAFVMLEN